MTLTANLSLVENGAIQIKANLRETSVTREDYASLTFTDGDGGSVHVYLSPEALNALVHECEEAREAFNVAANDRDHLAEPHVQRSLHG